MIHLYNNKQVELSDKCLDLLQKHKHHTDTASLLQLNV